MRVARIGSNLCSTPPPVRRHCRLILPGTHRFALIRAGDRTPASHLPSTIRPPCRLLLAHLPQIGAAPRTVSAPLPVCESCAVPPGKCPFSPYLSQHPIAFAVTLYYGKQALPTSSVVIPSGLQSCSPSGGGSRRGSRTGAVQAGGHTSGRRTGLSRVTGHSWSTRHRSRRYSHTPIQHPLSASPGLSGSAFSLQVGPKGEEHVFEG